jgi:hypothetical protein
MAAEGIIGPAKDGPQARQVLDHNPDDPTRKE